MLFRSFRPSTGKDFGISQSSSYEDQAKAALKYFKSLKGQFGDEMAAAQAYNVGPGAYSQGQRNIDYASKYTQYMSGFDQKEIPGNNVKVVIDKMNITAPDATAKGIVNTVSGAIASQCQQACQ